MIWLEGVRIALDSLRTHKLRTFLTLLGNIVGTMSVIAVVSLINGVDIYARQEVLSEGSNVFTVARVNFFEILTDMDAFLDSLDNPDLDLDDRAWLAERVPEGVHVGAHLDYRDDLRAGDRVYENVELQGKTADYHLIEEMPLRSGRHLTPGDVSASRAVAVLGAEVADALFPGAADPSGRVVKLGGRHVKVVGVAAERGAVMGQSRDRFAVTPITTLLKTLGNRESIELKVAAPDLLDMETLKEETRHLMRVRHRLRPGEDDDFGVVTQEELLRLWSGISNAIYAALVPLVGISLVVGGIVLMNIMLVVVTERTREIGVRKAVGARRSSILWQFMVESVTLSVVGGVMGVLIGLGLAGLIAAVSPLPFAFAAWAPILGLVVTFLVGVVFGTYPAWKAASLDPVEALRHE